MLQVRIALNEEKIAREQTYSVASMWRAIDDAFLRSNQEKVSKGIYQDAGFEGDYGRLSAIIFALADCAWFTDNVAEWYWLNTDECDEEQDLISSLCNGATA